MSYLLMGLKGRSYDVPTPKGRTPFIYSKEQSSGSSFPSHP